MKDKPKTLREGEKIGRKPTGKKEKLFCLYYTLLRNGRDAAARAGYALHPEEASAKLLERREIAQEIARLSAEQTCREQEVAAGLRRLAFGSVSDAMRLLLSDGQPVESEIEQMDFFNVAEIKRPKGGGLEIKFFDRLKPLEKLAQLSEGDSTNGALPFFEALDNGAKALAGRGHNE